MKKWIYALIFVIAAVLSVYADTNTVSGTDASVPEKITETADSQTETPGVGNIIVEEEETKPEYLKAEQNGMLVKLVWQVPGNSDDFDFDIYRSTEADDGFLKINKEPVKGSEYTDNADNSIISVQSGIKYFYKVAAVRSGKEYGESNVVFATPLGVLLPPSNFKASAELLNVHLTWEMPDSTGTSDIKGYNIFRSTFEQVLGQNLVNEPLNEYEYLDENLEDGVTYWYALQSVDEKGKTSDMTGAVSVVPYRKASKPVNVSATAVSSESIKISWAEPDIEGTFGISGYNIYRSENNSTSFSPQPINTGLIKPYRDEFGKAFYYDNMILSVSPPKPGINYFYKIIPVDADGHEGLPSEPVTSNIPVIELPKSGILSADISQYGLPPESRLNISGRKSVLLGGNITLWEESPETITEQPFIFEQTFRVKVKGNIGKNIFVDVDYDDQNPTDEQTKISIKYQGEKGDAIQEASFGDITLNLPSTRYASYTQTLFGIKINAELGEKFSLTAIAAQTKGITDVQTFRGKLRTKETNGKEGYTIPDRNYIRDTYFYLSKDPMHVSEFSENAPTGVPVPPEGTTVTIKPGTVLIYTADQIVTSNDANTVYSYPNKVFNFKKRYLGTDYTVDYRTGIVKFNNTYLTNRGYSIAVAYETSTGERVGYDGDNIDLNEANLISDINGYTSNNAHLIQDGRQSSSRDISHQVLNYYYLGETQIENPKNDPSFEIKIERPDGTDVTPPNFQPSQSDADRYYEIDNDLGIIKFKGFYPFSIDPSPASPDNNSRNENDLDPYNQAAPTSLYNIFLKYNYYVSSYRLDHFPVVFGSERVFMDGRLLRKDVDYYIFYETGEITFVDRNQIQPSTEIRIAYEYFPFFQTFQNTVAGMRAEYKLFDNLTLGSTVLYKFSNSGTTIPDARSTETSLSTPASMFLAEGDVKFDLNKEYMNMILSSVPLVGETDLPVDFAFHGEMAYSGFNPNTFEKASLKEKGVAMVDSMEGADNTLGASMDKESWFPASIPLGFSPEDRVFMAKSDVTEDSDEVAGDTSATDTTTRVTKLKFDFSNIADNRWDSFRYAISTYGENLNLYNYLDMYITVNTNNPIRFDVDVGIISEDSNGNGLFAYNTKNGVLYDSEDTSGTGSSTLLEGDDVGISNGIYTPDNRDYWGAGNNKVDTEDMNLNGQLDTTEAFYRFSSTGGNSVTNHNSLRFSESKLYKISIPLRDFTQAYGVTTNTNDPNFFAIIKHLRITVHGAGSAPAAGSLKIEKIEFTGNSWQLRTRSGSTDLAGNPIDSPDTEKFNVETISKNVDDSYVPNTDYFEYQNDDDKNSEEGLKIKYSLSAFDNRADGNAIFYTTKFFTNNTGYDYQQYRKMKIDVLYKQRDGSAGPGRTMFIRLGSDSSDENHYYQYTYQLDDIAADNTWQTIEFMIDGSDKKRGPAVGTPNLRRVRFITIGFLNPNNTEADDIVYINNIRISDPIEKSGFARYANSVMNYDGFGKVTHTFEEKDTGFVEFTNMEKANYSQHYVTNKGRFDYSQLSFLTSYIEASETKRYVEDKFRDDPSYTGNFAWPDTDTDTISDYISFTMVPGLTLSYANTIDRTESRYSESYSNQENNRLTVTHGPYARYLAPSEINIGDAFKIPLGSNTFESRFTITETNTDYLEYNGFDPTTSYYDQWKNVLNQIHSWTGSFSIDRFTLSPYYQYTLVEEKGNLTSNFVYYADVIGERNYIDRFLVTKRDINPKLKLTMGKIGIFTPMIDYNSSQRTEYTSNQLYSSGSLDFTTAVGLKEIVPILPDITSLSVSISDTNRRYDNNYYHDTFEKYFGEKSIIDEIPGDSEDEWQMDFMDRWYVNIWKFLIDEDEIRKFESISYSGNLTSRYGLNFADINVFGAIKFAPGVSYDRNRTSSTRALSKLSDSIRININSITISGITIPGLDWLINNQTITGHYRYSVTRDFDTIVWINEREEKTIVNRVSHDSSIRLPFRSSNGFNGSLGTTFTNSDSINGNVTSWNWVLSPSLNINYSWKIEAPLKMPGWLPFIGNKVFKFQNNLDLHSTLSAIISRGGGDQSNSLNNRETDVYTGNLGASYNFLNNIRATFDMSYKYNRDGITANRDYQSLGINLEVVAEF